MIDLLLGTFVLVAPPFPLAQQQQQPPPAVQPAPAPATEYVVGPQDLLTITVFDEPTISGRYRIDADGSITFPMIGRAVIGGLTLRGVEEQLTKLLAEGYIKNPQVSVEVEQYKSQSVFIVGEVRSPGKYSLSGNMTLIEALAQAGSTLPGASDEVLVVHPKKDRGAVGPIFPSDQAGAEVVHVNIKDLQSGKLSQNLSIQDGDTIFVPKAETFFITGQVKSPGSYVLGKGMTVLQALSLAGGVTERGSDRRIKIVRLFRGQKVEISVKLNDLVQPGDTIVVPQRFF